ncbi:D-aspartate oxidase [Mycena venus]|uniref:D-aspartate oxidase n=1 Tax=Mycena venus TaxID=2733690 RepID=A0A8H6YZA2_9AGAR|nr:D-aspartate oxidase [Mycena venus]
MRRRAQLLRSTLKKLRKDQLFNRMGFLIMSFDDEEKQIVVIGAGVVGLTTAIKLQEKGGYQVTIVAEILPTDRPSSHYTSHWAGGHHSTAGESNDRRQQQMYTETFRVFWEMSEPGHPAEKCFIRTPQYEHYYEETSPPGGSETTPDFKLMERSDLLPGAAFGISFTVINFDPKAYLDYLHKRFLAAGGRFVHGSVQHIKQVVEGGSAVFEGQPPAPPAAVIVCAGLGARSLGGVEDKTMTPVRGQTVILNAPWVRFGSTRRKIEDEMLSYVIPRRSGHLVIGGTMNVDDWYPAPREETKIAILEKALALWPEISPPEARKDRVPTIEDLYPIVVEEGLGLRPRRNGGIRLAIEWIEAQAIKAPVVFNYGHEGSGFESSWGSASIALELMEEALKSV